MINLIVEEHIEWDLIINFILIEIDVAGIIHGAYNILYASTRFENSVSTHGGVRRLIESNVIVFFIPALLNVANEFHWQHRCGIDITFVFVSYLEKIIEE